MYLLTNKPQASGMYPASRLVWMGSPAPAARQPPGLNGASCTGWGFQLAWWKVPWPKRQPWMKPKEFFKPLVCICSSSRCHFLLGAGRRRIEVATRGGTATCPVVCHGKHTLAMGLDNWILSAKAFHKVITISPSALPKVYGHLREHSWYLSGEVRDTERASGAAESAQKAPPVSWPHKINARDHFCPSRYHLYN